MKNFIYPAFLALLLAAAVITCNTEQATHHHAWHRAQIMGCGNRTTYICHCGMIMLRHRTEGAMLPIPPVILDTKTFTGDSVYIFGLELP